jgi:hypothetical protein
VAGAYAERVPIVCIIGAPPLPSAKDKTTKFEDRREPRFRALFGGVRLTHPDLRFCTGLSIQAFDAILRTRPSIIPRRDRFMVIVDPPASV